MPILIPLQTITVGRDGKNVVPPIGQAFDFTDEEAKQIKAMNPKAVREPVNEAPQVVDPAVSTSADGGTGEVTAGKKAGGKKATEKEPADL